MSTLRLSRPAGALVALLVAGVLAACSGDDSSASSGTPLVGRFGIEAGACAGAASTGSTFRMVQPNGDAQTGPFVTNPDSPCADKSVTPLQPGSEGGLVTGEYQPSVDPAFGPDGTSTATKVISATPFFAVGFGVATDEADPQSKKSVDAPSIFDEDGKLTGDLSALAVSWNGQFFNQGAPKPGATGGDLRGTYDASTKAYTLDWTSLIEGGPFDGFTGIWHLEGTFTSA